MGSEWRTRLSLALALVFVLSTTAFGQQALRGSIFGTVKDDTGAAMPGVTVTVTSPALQVPSIVRVSDAQGGYQVPELPIGSYKATYELSGFATLIREGIVITTGFQARVDVVMKVATLAETVTVSGESPLVDVVSTRGGATLSNEVMTSLPTNMNFKDLVLAVGGMVNTSPPQPGQVNTGASGFAGKSYGSSNSGTVVLEGVKANPNESPDYTAYDEIDVKTFGNTADVDVPGAAVQLVVKSGGNQLHGTYNETFQNKNTQSNNITASQKAQGLTGSTGLNYFNDASGDLGGRIVRDKLWFYGNIRNYANEQTIVGFAASPAPGLASCKQTCAGNETLFPYGAGGESSATPHSSHISVAYKISWQVTPKNKLLSVRQENDDWTGPAGTRFTPLESTFQLNQYMAETKPIEWQGTLSNRWLVDVMWGFGGYDAKRFFPEQYLKGAPAYGTPTRYDLVGGYITGPAYTQFSTATSPAILRRNKLTRQQASGSVNYAFPGLVGSHAFQLGYRVWNGTQLYENPNDPGLHCDSPTGPCIGEYELIYNTVGGVPRQPFQLSVHNVPVHGTSIEREYAVYLMDGWRPTQRLTLNLGVRWERQVHFVPPQVKAKGTFSAAGSFPKVSVGAWNAAAPRVGAAFDLTGNGKTVLKGTYGWYNYDLGISGFASLWNQNTVNTVIYKWSDPTHCNCYVPGTVNLDTNGGDFVQAAGAVTNVLNPDLKLPHTHEATASIERELGKGMSFRALYVFKKDIGNFSATATNYNTLRPASLYSAVFTRQDLGPDGKLSTADDGGMFTIYDYPTVYRGAAFVAATIRNADSDKQDSFRNIELSFTKRSTGKWFANSSLLATKNHRYLIGVMQSPNDLINNLDETWDLNWKLAGGYNLPYGFLVSLLYQGYTGLVYQRTVIFNATDPAGGPAFPGSATITLPVEKFGATRGPHRNLTNVRFGKDFQIGAGKRLKTSVDVQNVFNSGVPWGGGTNGSGINGQSGSTYGFVQGIVSPRMVRFNLGYTF